jgi:hypothetical protein
LENIQGTVIIYWVFFSLQAEVTTPRDQGYGMRIMFYPISVTLSATPALLNVKSGITGLEGGQVKLSRSSSRLTQELNCIIQEKEFSLSDYFLCTLETL